MSEVGIRLTGLGGQGVVLSSVILGRAASVYDELKAVQTQTYGSDMRGGDVCTEIIISKQKIVYPIVNFPDILIALAQSAFEQHIESIKNDGILITDTSLVKINGIDLPKDVIHYQGDFNKMAIDVFHEKRVANMIMLGFISKRTSLVTLPSLKKAMRDLLPPKTHTVNQKALDLGIELAQENSK